VTGDVYLDEKRGVQSMAPSEVPHTFLSAPSWDLPFNSLSLRVSCIPFG